MRIWKIDGKEWPIMPARCDLRYSKIENKVVHWANSWGIQILAINHLHIVSIHLVLERLFRNSKRITI